MGRETQAETGRNPPLDTGLSPRKRAAGKCNHGRAGKARAVLETISCIQQLARQGAADADGPVRDPLVDL